MNPNSEGIACRTKVRYASKAQAKKSLKQLRSQGRRDLMIYECWYCDRFHLGNPPGRQTYVRSGDPKVVRDQRTG